jgi:hypothetical protein
MYQFPRPLRNVTFLVRWERGERVRASSNESDQVQLWCLNAGPSESASARALLYSTHLFPRISLQISGTLVKPDKRSSPSHRMTRNNSCRLDSEERLKIRSQAHEFRAGLRTRGLRTTEASTSAIKVLARGDFRVWRRRVGYDSDISFRRTAPGITRIRPTGIQRPT